MLAIIEKVISIFMIIGIGYFAGKAKLLPEETRLSISALLLKITCPSMILAATASIPVTESTLSITLWSMILSLGFFILLLILGYVMSKYILKVKDPEEIGMLTYGFHTNNTGFFGFPVSLAIFGNSIFFIFIIQNTIMGFFLFGLGILTIEIITGNGQFNFKTLFGIFKSPPIVASFIGVFMMFAGIKVPAVIHESLDLVGSSTTPLSMLLVGIMLSERNIGEMLTDKTLLLFSLAKNIIAPIICFLILFRLPIHQDIKVGLTFAFAFPTAVMVAPMVESYGYKPDKAAEMIALTSLIGIITLPICATLLTLYYNL